MSLRNRPRRRILEGGLAVLVLLTPVFLLGAPPEWFADQSYDTPVGFVSGVGVWILPALLSVLALYRATTSDGTVKSIVAAGLGVLTLLILLLNVRTTVTSGGGLLRYEGRGTFYGPFVSLLTGCLLAVVVLLDTSGGRESRPADDTR